MLKRLLCLIGIVILLIGGGIGLALLAEHQEDKKWNDGYCSCGGKLQFEQVVGHAYTTTYMYSCEDCGNYVEFTTYRPPIK